MNYLLHLKKQPSKLKENIKLSNYLFITKVSSIKLLFITKYEYLFITKASNYLLQQTHISKLFITNLTSFLLQTNLTN